MAFFSLEQIDTIYKSTETDLCTIMNKYGSDKGSYFHNYTKLYSVLFSAIRNNPLSILEIGIGSVNSAIPSNMVCFRDYRPGASHRGWKEYFPNATIYGCDIDRDITNFQDSRIHGFYGDQTNVSTILDAPEVKNNSFDIIVDDGLHKLSVNLDVLNALRDKVKKGGWYIVEDIYEWTSETAKNVSSLFKDWQYIEFPSNRPNSDNNILIIRF